MKKSFCLFMLVGCLLTPLAAQTIKVDSPNGGEPMVLGDKWQIKWTATNVSGNVKIQLIKPGGAIIGVIAPNLAPGGSPFPWTVGQTNNGTAATGNYKIRVMALNGSASDASDKAFTISAAGPVTPPPPPSGDPTLQLTSFNDGGIFPLGMPQNITWNANWSGTVKLELYQNGTRIGIIDNGVASQPGTYPWNVGTMLLKKAGKGEGYKVRVVKEYKWLEPVPLDRLDDESDNAFKIGLSLSDLTPGINSEKIAAIVVTKPEKDQVFFYGEYGRPIDEFIDVGIAWKTSCLGSFNVKLCDRNGNPIEDLHTILPDLHGPGPFYDYYILDKFSRRSTPMGAYRILVQSDDLKHSGLSGVFRFKAKVYMGEKKPDLVVCKYLPKILKAGDNKADLEIFVMNVGAAASTTCWLRIDFKGQWSINEKIGPIDPGRWAYVTKKDFMFHANDKEPLLYTLYIDPNDDVKESHEGNNILDGALTTSTEEEYKCSDGKTY